MAPFALLVQGLLPKAVRMTPSQMRRTCLALTAAVMLLVYVKVNVIRHWVRSDGKPPVVMQPCLVADGQTFKLNNKSLMILSGAIHYFRVPSAYWEDRMLKLKAMGLNTLETYVPWNLHEPQPGVYDFTGMLDLRKYISLAGSLGLNVILRPGPYICSEWDFGGLPAWLMRDRQMKVRTLYPPFVAAVERYFNKLLPLVADLQCHRGGPVIAFQIENEYGSFGEDASYMRYLQKAMVSRGIAELLFTSDNMWGSGLKNHLLPDVLQTANFQKEWRENMELLHAIQPNRPMMVMELWSGWFDHWRDEHHHTVAADEFAVTVANLLQRDVSINFYMFHGGTNFGFMNGANDGNDHSEQYMPDVTSYDYDAPLSEWGDVTPKFEMLRQTISKLVPSAVFSTLPAPVTRESYGSVVMHLSLPLLDALSYLPKATESKYVLPMEMLKVNADSGQGYGYAIYRAKIHGDTKTLRLSDVRDWAAILLAGESSYFMERWKQASFELKTARKDRRLVTIVVENMGRVNYGTPPISGRKGIIGNVWADGEPVTGWKTYSLEFKPDFLASISSGGTWERSSSGQLHTVPTLFKSTLRISGEPADTFIDMTGWHKGAVFVNGINLGRYWHVGPQKRLYVPAPFLHTGINTVIIFELQRPPAEFKVTFTAQPGLGGVAVLP